MKGEGFRDVGCEGWGVVKGEEVEGGGVRRVRGEG